MQRIYCISGLAADHRLFQNLVIPGYELTAVPWVKHAAGDSLASYSAKMAAKVTEANPVIIGLSMGGMIATEIGKLITTKHIILISSAKNNSEVGKRPYILELIGRTGLMPAAILNIPYPQVLKNLGATTREETKLLSAVMRDSNPFFMKWAIKAVLGWRSTKWPGSVFHIHGTADKILQPKFVKPDVWVEGGSHIMILNRAAEISRIIADHLAAT